MDSKWGIPLVATLAGMGLFLSTRPSKLVKEATYGYDPLKAGWPNSESPQGLLDIIRDSQLANREYYREMIMADLPADHKSQLPYQLRRNLTNLRVYDEMCDTVKWTLGPINKEGILSEEVWLDKKGTPIILADGKPVRKIIPRFALNTHENWDNMGYSTIGGPLNPIEGKMMNMGSSRFHTQTMISHLEPQSVEEWKHYLRSWERGQLQSNYVKMDGTLTNKPHPKYADILAEDPRIAYHDFDLFSNAFEVYKMQFTLPGLTVLRRKAPKRGKDGKSIEPPIMPFDFTMCYKFMYDFLVQYAYLGGKMESDAIKELKALPNWPDDWEIVKTHRDLDNSGADLMVFKKNPNDPNDIQDAIGFIQVKPFSFIRQNLLMKNSYPTERMDLDKLIHQARSFHNPFYAKKIGRVGPQWGEATKNQFEKVDKVSNTNWKKIYDTGVLNPKYQKKNDKGQLVDKNAWETFVFIRPKIGTKVQNFKKVTQKDINKDPVTYPQSTLGQDKVKTWTDRDGTHSRKEQAALPNLFMRPTTRDEIYLQLLVYDTVGGYGKPLNGEFLNLKAVARRLIENEPDPVLEGVDIWTPPHHSPASIALGHTYNNQWRMQSGEYTTKQDWWDDKHPTPVLKGKTSFISQKT